MASLIQIFTFNLHKQTNKQTAKTKKPKTILVDPKVEAK